MSKATPTAVGRKLPHVGANVGSEHRHALLSGYLAKHDPVHTADGLGDEAERRTSPARLVCDSITWPHARSKRGRSRSMGGRCPLGGDDVVRTTKTPKARARKVKLHRGADQARNGCRRATR